MAARNTLKNKKLRREQREENRRKQEKKRIASRVKDSLGYSSLLDKYLPKSK